MSRSSGSSKATRSDHIGEHDGTFAANWLKTKTGREHFHCGINEKSLINPNKTATNYQNFANIKCTGAYTSSGNIKVCCCDVRDVIL